MRDLCNDANQQVNLPDQNHCVASTALTLEHRKGRRSMKAQFLPLAAAWMSALVTPATAGQPLRLSDAQMDRVTAGAVGSATSSADALGNLAAQTLTFVLG